jgi:hypothetical protein
MVRDNLQSLTVAQDDREKKRESESKIPVKTHGPRVTGFRLSAGSTQQVM